MYSWYMMVPNNCKLVYKPSNNNKHYPLVNIQKAIEHGHRNSEFTQL